MHSELVVLGGGPGGYAAAFLAADQGLEVTIVEAEPRLGGTCLLRGCIPSKALLHVARVISEASDLGRDWGVAFGEPAIDLESLRSRKEQLVTTLSSGLSQLAKRRKVKVVAARGMFQDSSTLKLSYLDSATADDETLTFKNALIATGSVPAMPPVLQVDSSRLLNSTSALQLSEIPESLLVVGGGYIGLEMSTVYARLGSRVSIVEMTDGLLPGVDRDLVKPLFRRLNGLLDKRIHLSTQVTRLTDLGDGLQVDMIADGETRSERFSHVLVAVGRRPASERLGLENTEVRLDDSGFVVTDQQFRTGDAHIMAVGDVAGEPMLAHKATHEAKLAVDALLGKPSSQMGHTIPAVVFTEPEIAWTGLTETVARATAQACRAAIYPWAASGRAHTLGHVDGLTKWLVDPETDRVVGCGIVGPGAGELIGQAVMAIDNRLTVSAVGEAIHPHPTLSETMMNAADVYLGTALEIYKPRRG